MTALAPLRLLLFFGGVFLSQSNIEQHWVTGPVFGAVVLFWYWSFLKKFDAPRYLGFFAASTLIYALVVEMMKWDTPEEGLLGFFIPGLLAGTVLMLLAYRIFLGLSWKRVFMGVPLVYAAAYAAGTLFEGVQGPMARIFLGALCFWQATYLAVVSKK